MHATRPLRQILLVTSDGKRTSTLCCEECFAILAFLAAVSAEPCLLQRLAPGPSPTVATGVDIWYVV